MPGFISSPGSSERLSVEHACFLCSYLRDRRHLAPAVVAFLYSMSLRRPMVRRPSHGRGSVPALSLLLALCFAPLSLHAAEPQWQEFRSAHFTVVTDAGDKKGREIVLRFEQMRAVFAELLARKKVAMPVPLTIYALKDDKRFFQMAPLHNGQPISVPGFFLPAEDHQFIVLNTFEEEPWRAVAHDFAHLMLNYNYPPTQGWFDEGFAEYFSSIRLDNKQVEMGSDPELASANTEDLLGNQTEMRTPPKSLTELLSSWVWLSLPDLFTMKHDTSKYQEGTHRTLFYAQAWMTMHYLLNKDKLSETGTYFGLVQLQHMPLEEAIQQAYGMTPAQFDKAVKDYFHSLRQLVQNQDAARQPGGTANVPGIYRTAAPLGPDDIAINAKPVKEADADAQLAEVMVRIPERREQGLREIDRILKLTDKNGAPLDNEFAHRALAWVHLDKKEFPQAAEELGNAAALDPHDVWNRYYLALLKYRTAGTNHEEMSGLANMMIDLKVAIDWYPEFAEAFNMLAMARVEGGGAASALDSMKQAIALSPRNEQYVLNLGRVQEAGKKWTAAQETFEQLKSSSNPQIAAAAKHQLEELPTFKKYGISPSAPKRTPQSSPFDELEQEAQKRAQTPDPTIPDKRPTVFSKGILTSVDCSKAPAATVLVNTGARSIRLRAADYKALLVIGEDQFSCEWKNRKVAVNYKAGGTADGDLVSLEVQ
jgi:tetratricopeptide (TPR) repeat protein